MPNTNAKLTEEEKIKRTERLFERRRRRCKKCLYSIMDEYQGLICECKDLAKEKGEDFLYPEDIKGNCKYMEYPVDDDDDEVPTRIKGIGYDMSSVYNEDDYSDDNRYDTAAMPYGRILR